MKKIAIILLSVICATVSLTLCAFAQDKQPKIPPMPAAVSGNAVASLQGGLEVFSLMGIGGKRNWDEVSNQVYVLHLKGAKWSTGHPVPGVAGRLNAMAVGAKGKIYLFGGFILDNQGAENTVGDTNVYLPNEQRWYRGEDIPVPVDSAVIGVTHDRFIYLIGGRSKNGPVNLVQVYDLEKNTWSTGTPSPGTPVYGHAGAIGDDTIVYVDGAKKSADGKSYEPSDECWMGKIDKKDPDKIVWSKLPVHPGAARFGIVAGEMGHRILFTGGTAALHDFKGLGADGKPVEFSKLTFAYDGHANKWESIEEDTFDPRSDTGAIVSTPIGEMVAGGMVNNTAVTARAVIVPKK
jgi:N-acetylneuraminic acid mutarotase